MRGRNEPPITRAHRWVGVMYSQGLARGQLEVWRTSHKMISFHAVPVCVVGVGAAARNTVACLAVENGDLRCKMRLGWDRDRVVLEKPPNEERPKSPRCCGMEAEEEEHDDDWRCAASDMMRRRCDASNLAGWLAGTSGPAKQEGGNNG